MEKNRLWDVVNDVLDELDMSYGIDWTVGWLYDHGYTNDEIRTLGYDYSDEEIEQIVNRKEN